ncbi:rod shape-determining protein [bacterium]|nr:rod shape-determining protein [bacterium]
MSLFERFFKVFSNEVGIDLGTANTLVYIKGYGIVINEPSVVAVNQKTGQVVAVGRDARQMLGRTPAHIVAVRPLVDGVISNFEVTEEMLIYLLNKVAKISKRFIGPRVLVGVPSGITNVERRAVYDAARGAGAREVFTIEEPMAAAIGMRLPIEDPVGSMVIDIGGGTTDIAVISMGGIVKAKNLKVAGDHLNEAIINYIRNEFKILIGEKSAESVKIAIGSAAKLDAPAESPIRGRDLISGLPREVVITDSDIREALAEPIHLIVESAKEVLETTPPEILSDIMYRGVYVAGGGALIKNLDALLFEHLNLPIHSADDPLTVVARGTGIVLEDIDAYRDIIMGSDDELLPQIK